MNLANAVIEIWLRAAVIEYLRHQAKNYNTYRDMRRKPLIGEWISKQIRFSPSSALL